MVKNCCVLSCHNNRTTFPHLSYYIIPSETGDPAKRAAWLRALGVFHDRLLAEREIGGGWPEGAEVAVPWTPGSDYAYVCSEHFVSGKSDKFGYILHEFSVGYTLNFVEPRIFRIGHIV